MMTKGQLLLVIWILFTAIGLAAMIAALVWAVRSRQFSDQERARHLPLESGIPPDEEKRDAAPPSGESKE